MAKFSGMLVSLRFVNVTRNVTPLREGGSVPAKIMSCLPIHLSWNLQIRNLEKYFILVESGPGLDPGLLSKLFFVITTTLSLLP